MKRLLAMGKHVLLDSLIRQYEAKGFVVDVRREMSAEGISINDYDELWVLSGNGENDRAVAVVGQLALKYNVEQHTGRRLTCHLMVQQAETLRMLQTCDFCKEVRQRADIYPFTTDELWSRSIVLDYVPITIQSERHVHLVICGMGRVAETVAIQAALVAHYPNYTLDHSLRTRITMIDAEAEKLSEDLTKRYRHLFDNSYYRVVKPGEEKVVVKFHHPMYEGKREDFVDVEWEFVEAEPWDADVREKLRLWAGDERQLMTVVMAHDSVDKNQSLALLLPDELYAHQIPIHITPSFKGDGQGVGCYHFALSSHLSLIQMAKNVNYVYDCCYRENIQKWSGELRYAVEIDAEERERSWGRLSNAKRMSCICNAMAIATKMRSVGLDADDWEHFYDILQKDIELLAQTEHHRWIVEELILGFRPCTEEEQQAVETDISQKSVLKKRKIHYDLRAYNDLRADETGKSVKIYNLCLCSCLPLIARAFAEEKGGDA